MDKLGQFAKEVTRVSQEVGTEGQVLLFNLFPMLLIVTAENSVDKLSFWTSKAHGEN